MIEELIAKRQQITLQTMNAPRQNLTFKQLSTLRAQEQKIKQEKLSRDLGQIAQKDAEHLV